MSNQDVFVDPNLTEPDRLVLRSLLRDGGRIEKAQTQTTTTTTTTQNGATLKHRKSSKDVPNADHKNELPNDKDVIESLESVNDPGHKDFESTVFTTWDLKNIKLPRLIDAYFLQPYVNAGRKIVRVETDVVMLTHLLLYFSTSVPSAIFLYYRFSWLHGIAHWIMQIFFTGTYTLMMHQHIHMGGVLAKKFWLFDTLFPYITNPLMGHTWNSYYYHHVKHHHVEGNGPGDLSSTIRYQRDSLGHFMIYFGRFALFIWLELPLYFLRTGKRETAFKAAFWELSNYALVFFLASLHWRATLFAFILPLALMRVGLMFGNWGQHAFVDETDPNSDFRSSITLIDVTSNRHCYNDGYHTSHHLNPRRHWRDHPIAFLKQKDRYSSEHAIVFCNIDYMMLTIKTLQKDYMYLAKCVVPMGDQVGMSLDELAAMLRTKTRRFSEEEIRAKFGKSGN